MKPLWIALASVVVSGCGSSASPLLCGQIPDQGCPLGRGGTCNDHECAALYDCVGGAWTLAETCSGGASGAGGAGSGGAGAGGMCEPAVIDKTGETTGCMPDLQSPDCPAAAAETCPALACLTDCFDFFLCTKDGWIDVAYCDPDGEIVITKPGSKP